MWHCRIVLLASVASALGAFAGCGGLAPDDPTKAGPDGSPPDATFADAIPEATSDGHADVTSGAVSDSGPETASDGEPNSGRDATTNDANGGSDARPDAGPGGGPDAGPDSRPECWRLDFEAGPTVVLSSVCQSGVQNVPAGMTPNGSTILVQRGLGGVCSQGLSLFVNDEIPPGSGVYQPLAVPTLAGADTTFEEGVTITPDGLTLIAMNAAHTGFVSSTRSAVGLVDFGAAAAADFAQITTAAPAFAWAPVISGDGLAFYYVIANDPSANRNVIYESVRATTHVPFPAGTPMPPIVQSFAQYVNGLSMDRLAIFLTSANDNQTGMLSRATLTDPFTNPLAPNPPPIAPGLRSRPLAGCTTLVGSGSPGGCIHESVCTWSVR